MESVWQSYDSGSRSNYVKSIQALGALSAMFRQKSVGSEDGTAYISSKYQETMFARFFNGQVVDKGNDPYDVMIPSSTEGKQDLIGIKTFLNSSSSMQKIMQFKRVANEEGWATWIQNREYQRLIARISFLRNQKLRSTQSILAGAGVTPSAAFENIIYHYLSPCKNGTVYVGESDYSFMDENNLSFTAPDKSKRIASIYFTDGNHDYKYTPADSTLYMRFMHTSEVQNGGDIVDSFAVKKLEDPHASLMRLVDAETSASSAVEEYAAPLVVPNQKLKGSPRLPISNRRQIPYESKVDNDKPLTASPKMNEDNVSLLSAHSLPHSKSMDEIKQDVKSGNVFVFPIFRMSNRGGTAAGEVDSKSGLNVRLGAPKNKGSDVRRPVNEVEIKIPNARDFHEQFPDFFGTDKAGNGISQLRNVNGVWKAAHTNIDERTFELVLTQSGISMEAILTGDGNKQIMSKNKQQTLGSWILSQVFQLGEYEALDRNKLDQLGLDCIRLTRLGNGSVGMEFIKASDDDIERLWPHQPDEFRELATPYELEDV